MKSSALNLVCLCVFLLSPARREDASTDGVFKLNEADLEIYFTCRYKVTTQVKIRSHLHTLVQKFTTWLIMFTIMFFINNGASVSYPNEVERDKRSCPDSSAWSSATWKKENNNNNVSWPWSGSVSAPWSGSMSASWSGSVSAPWSGSVSAPWSGSVSAP